MKGIVLAGGSGTRLYPITMGVSKQLIPIYDKPMVYYPLSVLMLAGIRDIMIISTPDDIGGFKRLFGDGSELGINITYGTQDKPEGIAQSFLIAEKYGFLKDGEPCALILGDNIFYSAGLTEDLVEAADYAKSTKVPLATIFGIQVKDPERYGIVETADDGYGEYIVSIEEKPKHPKSDICVTGLYFYPSDILEKAHNVVPSDRGELEITSINQMYLDEHKLSLNKLKRGSVWLDTGTFDSLYEASAFVETIEKRSGTMICCPEEIAYNNGWIDLETLLKRGEVMKNNDYGQYLLSLKKRNSN